MVTPSKGGGRQRGSALGNSAARGGLSKPDAVRHQADTSRPSRGLSQAEFDSLASSMPHIQRQRMLEENRSKMVTEIGLSAEVAGILLKSNIFSVQQLLLYTYKELLAKPNMSRHKLGEIYSRLEGLGFTRS